MYYNHNLRTDLQEWKNRLYRASYSQFPNQIKYFINSVEKNAILNGLIKEACEKYPFEEDQLDQIADTLYYGQAPFESEMNQTSFNFQFIKSIIKRFGYQLQNIDTFLKSDFEGTREVIIEDFLGPIINYCHDSLDKSNSVTYLLEKYKLRTEWFMKGKLFEAYSNASKSYEQIFEDDLRLFLFDQGIDYPFSTPQSTSGRTDIVGAIDTSEPIIVEIKILDKNRNYGINRIQDGVTQIIKYTTDYNKDFGFLVLFNLDNTEINFKLEESNDLFPPRLVVNNKSYFLIVVNILPTESASKLGKSEVIELSKDDLLNSK